MSTSTRSRAKPASPPSTPKPSKTPAGAAKKPSRLWRWTKRLVLLGALLGLLGLSSLVAAFWYYGRDLPDVAALRDYAPPQTTRVLDRHGDLVGEIFSERRTVVPMERIPRVMVLCVLAAEDADFYQHEGVDYPGIVRALLRDLVAGRRAQGASTITQQVVKLLLLSPERTISRKIREQILARRLEQELTKDEILLLYLNHINFGHGRYGVQEAAQFYFGKDVDDLNLAEASLIAGIPQAPARLSPRSHPEAARRRQAYVLRQLEEKHDAYWPDLSLDDLQAARDALPRLVDRPEPPDEGAELMTVARRELRALVGDEAYARGGYTVHTTLDLALQRATRRALRRGLEAHDERQRHRGPIAAPRRARDLPSVDVLRAGRTYDARVTGADDEHGTLLLDVGGHAAHASMSGLARYNPDALPASAYAAVGARVRAFVLAPPEGDEPATVRIDRGPQGAAIVLDPRERDVLALVGSYEGGTGFDRALQAVRQPGSTFKPFVFALGLRQRRLTPATVMLDAPVVYDRWRPQNYETWNNEGPVRLRVALAQSINLVAVRAIEELGPEPTAAFARELGIESELEPSLALALGASGVRPIELVNAYATFAAGGRFDAPRFLTRVVGPDGREVPLPRRPPPRDALDPAEAYLVTSLLQSVTTSGGTAERAVRLGRPTAGKTGTSNEARDAWFVGYTPSVVAGVWVGYDDRRSLGRRESGGRTALPIWIEVIRAAEGERAALEFPRPAGVVSARVDPASGLLAHPDQTDAIEELFLEGTVPTETARAPDVADPSTFFMEQFGAEP